MEKTKRNWLITGIIAVAMIFSCMLGLNLNNQVQTAYALSNPISASNVWYSNGVSDKSFGTTMPTDYSFDDGTLIIADGATPYEIWTTDSGNLAVKFEGNYGNNTISISNVNGDLTLTSTTPVNVTLAGLYSLDMIHIEGKVNLTITGPSYSGSMDGQYSKFLVGCPNGTLFVDDDASVTAIDPVLHGKTISGTSFEAIFKVGALTLNTTGCFKVGLNTTPTSTDETYAIKVIDNGFSPVSCTKCDNGFVLYSNANKFICEGDSASDPDAIDCQTGLENKLKTIEDGNSLTIRQCQVSFDANSGSGTMDNESSYKGNYSLPNCSFTAPSGQQFKCWAVGSAIGTEYNAGANYTITDDVTFYAVWEDAQVQKQDRPAPVGVEAVDCQTAGNNDGQITGVSTEMEYQPDGAMDEWTEITGDTITGLTPGYYNVRYKETETYNASEPVQVCVGEYVAPATYTISFNANGGTGTMLDVENQTSPYTLPACDFEKEGWHFLEWAMGSTEGIRYSVSSEAEISENTTFYAIWEQDAPQKTLTGLTAVYNGGNIVQGNTIDGSKISLTLHYSDESTEPLVANADGVTYWYQGNQITNPASYVFGSVGQLTIEVRYQGQSDNMIVNVVAFPAAPQSIDAVYTGTIYYGETIDPDMLTVTLTYDDASTEELNLLTEVKYYDGENLITNPATYTFNQAGINTITIKLTANENITCILQINVNNGYMIIYRQNGGSGIMANAEHIHGDFVLPANGFTAPEGMKFKCWSVNGTEKAIGATIEVNANTFVDAIWEDKVQKEEITSGQAAAGYNVKTLFDNAKAGGEKVELTIGTAKVTFDQTAVNAIGGNTNITFTMTTSTNVEDINVAGAQKVINITIDGFTAGSATVEVPFNTAVPNGKVAKVYYVDAQGNKTDMNATFEDGKATFTATHFSEYVIAFEDEAVAPTNNGGLSAGAIVAIVLAVTVVGGIGGFALVWFVIKKKKWADFVALFKKK